MNRATTTETTTYITTDDGASLWTASTGAGTPIVLNHGGPGMWDYLAPVAAMIDGTARAHRWDQRGAGRSIVTPPYSAQRFVDDLDAIRTHFGYDRWIVGGHSWGAALALEYALQHPDQTRALIYISGTGIGAAWRDAYYANRQSRLEEAGAFERWDVLRTQTRTPDEDREYCVLTWMTDYVDTAAGRREAEAMLASGFIPNFEVNASVRPVEDESTMIVRCRELRIPVLIIHGEHDTRPVSAIASLAVALPKAETAITAGAGHLPWFEQPDTVAEVLRRFVGSVISEATIAS